MDCLSDFRRPRGALLNLDHNPVQQTDAAMVEQNLVSLT